MNELILQNFLAGISVLDFEQYLPKNNGYLSPVAREASRQWVRDRRPDWEYEQVQKASKVTFDIAVRPFFKVRQVFHL